jgi:hypothetical protein
VAFDRLPPDLYLHRVALDRRTDQRDQE